MEKKRQTRVVSLSTKAPQCIVESPHPPQVDLIPNHRQPLAWLLTVSK